MSNQFKFMKTKTFKKELLYYFIFMTFILLVVYYNYKIDIVLNSQ